MKPKFTPGPWKLLDWDDEYISITDNEQYEGICHVKGTYERASMEANARLISLAPEMFDELEFLVSSCVEKREGECADGTKYEFEVIRAYAADVRRIRQLLDKAREMS